MSPQRNKTVNWCFPSISNKKVMKNKKFWKTVKLFVAQHKWHFSSWISSFFVQWREILPTRVDHFKELVSMVYLNFFRSYLSQKMEFSVNDFFSKFEQIRRKLWISSNSLKTSYFASKLNIFNRKHHILYSICFQF